MLSDWLPICSREVTLISFLNKNWTFTKGVHICDMVEMSKKTLNVHLAKITLLSTQNSHCCCVTAVQNNLADVCWVTLQNIYLLKDLQTQNVAIYICIFVTSNIKRCMIVVDLKMRSRSIL